MGSSTDKGGLPEELPPRWWAGLWVSFGVLTRLGLPVPRGLTPRAWTAGLSWFWLAGAVVGALLAGLWLLSADDRLLGLRTGLVVVAGTLLTGAQGLRGAMGLTGILARDLKGRAAVGHLVSGLVGRAAAASALGLLLARAGVLMLLPAKEGWRAVALASLLGAQAIATAALVSWAAPNAEERVRAWDQEKRPRQLWPVAYVLVVTVVLLRWWAVLVVVVAAVTARIAIRWCERRCGGQTAASLAAVGEFTELAVLAVCAAIAAVPQ